MMPSKNQQKRDARKLQKRLEATQPASLLLAKAVSILNAPFQQYTFPLHLETAVQEDGSFEVYVWEGGSKKRFKVTVTEEAK